MFERSAWSRCSRRGSATVSKEDGDTNENDDVTRDAGREIAPLVSAYLELAPGPWSSDERWTSRSRRRVDRAVDRARLSFDPNGFAVGSGPRFREDSEWTRPQGVPSAFSPDGSRLTGSMVEHRFGSMLTAIDLVERARGYSRG